MKYLKRFENFNDEISVSDKEFKVGETVMCTNNIDNTFKKGSTFKIKKVENGVMYLGEDEIAVDIEKNKNNFVKKEINFSKFDRTEDQSQNQSEVGFIARKDNDQYRPF